MKHLWIAALAVTLLVMLVTVAWAQIEMPWSVGGNGGGHLTGSSYSLSGTVGQAAIGLVSGPSNIHGVGFWYYPFEELTDVVEGESAGSVRNWLGQNHPNPFNPVTTILFSITQPSHVSIKVYDVNGREVGTIVDEQLSPGQHQRVLDAEGLASGMYFYRMVAGGYVETRKLVLLK